jgi:hypothetical protein
MQVVEGLMGSTVGGRVDLSTRERNVQGIRQELHTARNSFREDRFSEIEDMVGGRRDTKKGDGAGEHKLDPQTASERDLLECQEGKTEYYPRMRANDRNRQNPKTI